MMTRKEIIENKIFTEDQLDELIGKCKEYYKSYLTLKEYKLSGMDKELEEYWDYKEESWFRAEFNSSKISIYKMLPYNVTVQFDKTETYPDKINFCVFLYDEGEHYIMKEFRIDAHTGNIIE